MRPGPLLIRAVRILCILALLVPVVPELVWLLVIAFALVVAASVWEAALLHRMRVQIDRRESIALPLGEEEGISFAVTTSATRPLYLTVRQRWPRLVETTSTTRREGLCKPGEVLHLDFHVRGINRGTAVLEPPWLGATMWGLAERIMASGGNGELNVIPNVKAVGKLHHQLNQFILRGMGNRAAPKLGKGREFDRLRDYVTDDDFRDIAWKASARHKKLIVKEFRLDRSQEIMVCLDRGHRMAARVMNLTRLDHAVNASILLSYICSRMEDRMGIVSFAEGVDRGLNPNRGVSHLRQVTSYVTGLSAQFRHTDFESMAANIRRRLHHRALILILTVLPEPEDRHSLIRAVRLLSPLHLPLLIVLTDRDLKAMAETLPTDKDELCRTIVAREIWEGRQTLMKELRQYGAIVVESTPEEVPTSAVNAYIDVKRRQLL